MPELTVYMKRPASIGSSTEVVVPLRTISSFTMLVAVKKSDVLRSVPPWLLPSCEAPCSSTEGCCSGSWATCPETRGPRSTLMGAASAATEPLAALAA